MFNKVGMPLVMLGVFLTSQLSKAATTHVIDSPQTTTFTVIGPDSVLVVDGGSITTVATGPDSNPRGINAINSHVYMFGGHINVTAEPSDGIDLNDASDLTMTAGSVTAGEEDRSTAISARFTGPGVSNISISGGTITAVGERNYGLRMFTVHNQGVINASITGGTFLATTLGTPFPGRSHAILVEETSGGGTINVAISGGSIKSTNGDALRVANRNFGSVSIDITGGEFEGFHAVDANGISKTDISGGLFKGLSDTITARGRAQINLSGGTIETQSSNDLTVLDRGILNIHLLHQSITIDGMPMLLPVGQTTPISQASGVLTGTLLDGTAFEYLFSRASTSSINLIAAPEPSAIALIGTMLLLVSGRRRGRS